MRANVIDLEVRRDLSTLGALVVGFDEDPQPETFPTVGLVQFANREIAARMFARPRMDDATSAVDEGSASGLRAIPHQRITQSNHNANAANGNANNAIHTSSRRMGQIR